MSTLCKLLISNGVERCEEKKLRAFLMVVHLSMGARRIVLKFYCREAVYGRPAEDSYGQTSKGRKH